MPLISEKSDIEKDSIRVKIPSNIKQEIVAYCDWAGIKDHGHFFAEAAKFVFRKDKDWQAAQNNKLITT